MVLQKNSKKMSYNKAIMTSLYDSQQHFKQRLWNNLYLDILVDQGRLGGEHEACHVGHALARLTHALSCKLLIDRRNTYAMIIDK